MNAMQLAFAKAYGVTVPEVAPKTHIAVDFRVGVFVCMGARHDKDDTVNWTWMNRKANGKLMVGGLPEKVQERIGKQAVKAVTETGHPYYGHGSISRASRIGSRSTSTKRK